MLKKLPFYEDTFFPGALFFMTRGVTLLELTSVFPQWTQPNDFHKLNAYLKLFNLNFNQEPPVSLPRRDGDNRLIELNIKQEKGTINRGFALTSFQTESASWTALVRGDGIEPDRRRYSRLFQLINDILKVKDTEVNYIVLPELSIPRNVLLYVASKLRSKKISLITGVEYEIRPTRYHNGNKIKAEVLNQLTYILATTNNEYNQQVFISQKK